MRPEGMLRGHKIRILRRNASTPIKRCCTCTLLRRMMNEFYVLAQKVFVGHICNQDANESSHL